MRPKTFAQYASALDRVVNSTEGANGFLDERLHEALIGNVAIARVYVRTGVDAPDGVGSGGERSLVEVCNSEAGAPSLRKAPGHSGANSCHV